MHGRSHSRTETRERGMLSRIRVLIMASALHAPQSKPVACPAIFEKLLNVYVLVCLYECMHACMCILHVSFVRVSVFLFVIYGYMYACVMCICVYIHIHIHTHTHTHTHTHMLFFNGLEGTDTVHNCINACIHTPGYIHTHTHSHTNMHEN
jgi:hypothetical protein